MKTFTFDNLGNLTVRESTENGDSQHDMQPEQIERHLPMFEAEMSAAELAQAQAIIDGLNAHAGQ